MDEGDRQENLWFDDEEATSGHRTGSRRRTIGVTLACAACVAAISVPVAVSLSSGNEHAALPPVTKKAVQPHLAQGQARRTVLAALSATTGSGSFNVTYEFDPPTPPTATTTTTTNACDEISGASSGLQSGTGSAGPASMEVCESTGPSTSTTTVTGHGTIDTNPFGMVAVSNVSGLGLITLRDNGTDIWEYGAATTDFRPGLPETVPEPRSPDSPAASKGHWGSVKAPWPWVACPAQPAISILTRA
jgi:hypothetical protein